MKDYNLMASEQITESYERIDEGLGRLARKYDWSQFGSVGMNRDDIRSELWIYVLSWLPKQIEKNDGEFDVSLNMGLLMFVCKNKAIDLYRKALKIREEELQVEDASVHSNAIDSITDIGLLYEEISNLFEINSKEREFLKLMAIESEAITSLSSGMELSKSNKSLDMRVAEALGFANSSSSGYRRVRGKVREAITEFMAVPTA